MLRFLTTSATALTLGAAGIVALHTPTHAAVERTTATPYALSAFGIGTVAAGGELPVASGKTAYRIIGCTNRAPVERSNHEAEATVPGLGVLSDVRTDVWTTNDDGVVSSNARHSVKRILIGEGSGFGTVELNAIESVSRAWHNAKGFHASWETDIGEIVYSPVEGGPSQTFPAPAPGETLTFPGLATIKLGSHARRIHADGAEAFATTVKIHVFESNTTSRIAHTSAKIGGGVKMALFRGSANATRAEGLDGNLTSGPTPYLPMPCVGTDGVVRTNDLAEVDLHDQIVASSANTSQMGDQTMDRAWGFEQASIAEVSLGDGQLVLQGIVAKATVVRKGSTLDWHVRGTTVGSITANGEPQELPDPGQALEIPGLARIETRIVEEVKGGVRVTSVRVTLLDGTGAVINLGQAELSILRSRR